VLLRPGKAGRRDEPDGTVMALEQAGVPVVARIEAPATVEGGDTVWLDDTTLLVGIGYRTGPDAGDALGAAFPATEVIAFDLPHWHGPGEVMHLMSLVSPLDHDLALVYPRIAPTRLLWLLAERGIEVVEVPDDEFETMGPNVLALGPRRALALEGNDETRRRMERQGVDVVTYRGDEISRKGDGGPTCLTRPLLRDA
jgi:N-dimethylarginine dimethylaminohydrolase